MLIDYIRAEPLEGSIAPPSRFLGYHVDLIGALMPVHAAARCFCVSLLAFDREARCFTRVVLPDLQASTFTKLGCFLGLATKGSLESRPSDKIIVEYLKGSMYRAGLETWLSV